MFLFSSHEDNCLTHRQPRHQFSTDFLESYVGLIDHWGNRCINNVHILVSVCSADNQSETYRNYLTSCRVSLFRNALPEKLLRQGLQMGHQRLLPCVYLPFIHYVSSGSASETEQRINLIIYQISQLNSLFSAYHLVLLVKQSAK
jgi:hypothetical protein